MKVTFPDALDELKTGQDEAEKLDSTDALDEVFGIQDGGDQNDALDTLETPKAEGKGTEQTTEQVTAEENKGTEMPEQTTEETTTEEKPAEETTTEETTTEEKSAEGTEGEVEKAADDVVEVVNDIIKELEGSTQKQEEVINDSALSNEEKEKLLSAVREKDDMIFELQSRLQANEDKLKGAITENQNFRLDGAVNQRFLDKFENDSDVQQFVNLKIKAEAGDEKAQAKMEEFLKSQLSSLGYDIDALVRQKKLAEKKALSNSPVGSSGYNYDESVDDGDALDTLELD